MKYVNTIRIVLVAAISILVASSDFAKAVKPGDSRSAVVEELGEPKGEMKMGKTQVLSYARGSVDLVDDVVVNVDLVSAEEAEAKRLKREAEEQQRQELARQRRAQRTAEGLEIYSRKISDPEFMNAPAAERVAFWRNFQNAYPDVELGEEYAQAQREYELETSARSAAMAAEEQRIEALAAEISSETRPNWDYGNSILYLDSSAVYRPNTERPGTRPRPIVERPPVDSRPVRPAQPIRPARPVRPAAR